MRRTGARDWEMRRRFGLASAQGRVSVGSQGGQGVQFFVEEELGVLLEHVFPAAELLVAETGVGGVFLLWGEAGDFSVGFLKKLNIMNVRFRKKTCM